MKYWRYTILLLVGALTALVYAGIEENLIFRDGFEKLPPVISSLPITTGRVDELYTYDVEATDPDGELLLYLLTQSPAGMSINNSSGLISWTPVAVGDFLVEVDVSNESGGSTSQAWMIAVDPAIDTDSDGLSDVKEALYGTDTEDPDSDDDLCS